MFNILNAGMFELYFIDNFSLRTYLNIKRKINGSYNVITVFTNRVDQPKIPPWACLYLLTTLDENKNTFIKNSTNKKYNLDDSKVDSILSVLKLIFLRKDFNIFENNLETIIDNQPHMVSFLYIIVRRFIRRLFPSDNANDENDKKNFNSCLQTKEANTDLFNKIKKGGIKNGKINDKGFIIYDYEPTVYMFIKNKKEQEKNLLDVFNGFYKKYKEKLEKGESIDFSVKRMLIVFQLFLVAKRILNQEYAPFPEPKEPKSTLTKIGNLLKNKNTNQPLPKTPQTSIGNSVSNPLKPKELEKPKIGKSVFPFKRPWRGGKNKTKRNIDHSKKSNKTLKNKTRR